MEKSAIGANEMATMKQIQLLLSSTMFGLHRLNVFLPSLTALNLDGSSLDSLRDLGSELTLKYLNVSRCGLRSLDGINGMQMVEQLVADNNKIEYVLPLTELSELQSLSLKGFVSNSFRVRLFRIHTNISLQKPHQNGRSIELSHFV